MFHIKFNKNNYAQDMRADMQSLNDNIVEYTKNVVDVLEKDALTHAYNRAFIEDIISSELARSSRYKLNLSLLILKLSKKDNVDNKSALGVAGEIIIEHIRLNDYFGKLSEDEYIIVTSNTSLGGAVILAEKISHQFSSQKEIFAATDYYFGVTQANETDNVESVLEKLKDALSHSIENGSHAIEIEV